MIFIDEGPWNIRAYKMRQIRKGTPALLEPKLKESRICCDSGMPNIGGAEQVDIVRGTVSTVYLRIQH